MTNVSEDIMVSISVICFNHSKFLEQCLDGLLTQETSFKYELLIHDDASSDNSQQIIKEYCDRFPNMIFPILQEENQFSKGVRGMTAKFNIPRSRGKYLCICEGDDYWTDPLKLQKQVDYMEANPDCAITFHPVKVLKGGQEVDDHVEGRFKFAGKEKLTRTDLLKSGNFIHTPTAMMRNVFGKMPMETEYSTVGDYFLYIICSGSGYIHRLPDKMAVYRLGEGQYSSLSKLQMAKKILEYQLCVLSYLENEKEKEILLKKALRQIKFLDKEYSRHFSMKNKVLNLLKKLNPFNSGKK